MQKLIIVLDNIRSVFNVGSIFRTADATGKAEIFICGMTPTPENPKIKKTALGSTETVKWRYFQKTSDAIIYAKDSGFSIYAVELTDKAEHFQKVRYPDKVALVLGHERLGVSQFALEMSDRHIMIPMKGIKESLNVSSTAAIVMFEALRDNEI